MPTPLHAHFEIPEDADSPYPMVPDDDDDAATAMAMVNPEMMIDMNMPGIVTPLFVDGAAPIGLIQGENSPFTYVDWQAMQSMVVTTGVTFAVQAVEIGANQVPLPIGEAVLVTCGPFECAEDSATPPELSIANSKMCTDWDPSVEIQVGKVDNDVIDPDTGEEATDGVNTNDGIDLGIVTSSGLKMNVKHIMSGVSGGRNSETSVEAAKGSNKTLAMKAIPGVIRVNGDNLDTDAEETDYVVCDNTYTDEDVSAKADRPGGDAGCFRLIGPGAMDRDDAKGPDYLAGWSIELTPMGADVAWGNVDWKENPFEDLECGAMDPIMVADRVDICDMFDTEVSMATGKGWKPEVVFNNNRAVMWRAGATAASGHEKMFKTLWFDDNLNGKIKDDATKAHTNERPSPDGGTTTANALHDLYDQNGNAGNLEVIWEYLIDSNRDLIAGDLGKVDFVSDTDDFRTADDERSIEVEECSAGVTWSATNAAGIATGCDGSPAADAAPARYATHPDGKADNYPVEDASGNATGFADFRGCSEDDGGDDADGTECDAEWVNDVTILFADGTFGCSTTRDITVTCTWDADGGMAVGRNALPIAADLDSTAANTDNNRANFIKCTAK